jgi:hypothetical protein
MAATKLNAFLSGIHPAIRRGENRFLLDAFCQAMPCLHGGYLHFFFVSCDKDRPSPQ